ncbi:FMR1-interacting protein NUFIP1-like [Biomphalaria glabrata]|uniref:FMR1-interacting protein NUFIP1-like n=1 Tax=Biomphalaria glabrata TaxID=6526 RepID=A0A9W2Z234_BIOGL|nr:FMR1-interacting protein NUFIP1-like [Biomphalaria glabrata]XP_055869126.1 FMR1-interacting protein NUFIP1-like [Biomphalaria glabrata]XP_055869127.1 FMR1-interacting protein NUFIP1-like [Biomphalaria glabrata]XP_055869128.1 FMR1-interacting protein NUFIP1-like [Biomphalaria glabrata]
MSGLAPDFSKPPPPFNSHNPMPVGRFPPPNFHNFPPFPPPPPMMQNQTFVQNQTWNSFSPFPNTNGNRCMQPHLNHPGQIAFNSIFQGGHRAVSEGFPHSVRMPQFLGQGRGGASHANNNAGYRGHQRGGRQEGFQKKKEKIDKRLLPENNVFFCDICDRGFKNEELYKVHNDGHIKCSYKDCPFFAAPKLVQLHMSMQHRTGLAQKVWSLESDDDVKKWCEERKKNFPTLENVERKKKENAERLARGERLQTKDFSKFGKDRSRGRGRRGGRDNRRGRGHRGRGRGRRFNDYDQFEDEKPNSDDDAPEEVRTVKEVSHPEPDQPEPTVKDNKTSTTSKENSGLGLLAYYGSSCSDSDDSDNNESKTGPTELITKEQPPATVVSKSREGLLPNPFASPTTATESCASTSTTSCVSDGRADLAPSAYNSSTVNVNENNNTKSFPQIDSNLSDVPLKPSPQKSNLEHSTSTSPKKEIGDQSKDQNFSHKEEWTNKKNDRQKRPWDNRGDNQTLKRKKVKHDYTLLEKLLAPDIRRERNKILQCVHYIVQCKFFDNSPASGDVI